MSEKKNIENFHWEQQAKYLIGEASSQEKSEVESWLNQSDINQEELNKNQQLLEQVDRFYKVKSYNTKAAWQDVHSKLNPRQLKIVQRKNGRKEAIVKFYKYAAILVVALLLGSIGYYIGFRNQAPAIFSEIISAENQVLNEYVLPDGSVVSLNSNSQLIFPKKFRNGIREVTITGEAFFDVKPNPEKPFVINAGNAQVKVLGTSFTVSAYPENKTIEVVVETGKVQVINKNAELSVSNDVFLIPGEKGTLFIETNKLEKSDNSELNYLAWKTQDLIFNEVPLHEVIECLEKTYHVTIELAEPELNELPLTAHFDKKPIEFVLNVVQLTFNLDLSGENEHFILAGRTKKQ